MTETIRCPACRGAKKVPKLGGMIGECNTCSGKGNILAVDKPKPVIAESLPYTNELIKATADCVPASTVNDDIVIDVKHISPDTKIDPKKALYKRKTASK